MKEYNRELSFLLHSLNPFQQNSKEDWEGLDELRLIKILKKNKVLSKFNRKLDLQPNLRDQFLSSYLRISQLIEELKSRQDQELEEFIRISKRLAKKDVNLLLIKSAGEFPHESSNFDCLIRPDALVTTARMLHEEGYRENLICREPHKFLFRKEANPKDLPLHIHTRVEWEAVDFAEPNNLRSRARSFMEESTGALVPSVEDAILITIAHYFFEDHQIKLYDLLKLCSLSNEKQPEWSYMFQQVNQLGWEDAYALNIQLLNRMSVCCFGQRVFPKWDETGDLKQSSIVSRAITFDTNGTVNIPYGVSALFFLRKLFRNQNLSFGEKSKHIDYVLSDILRRKVIGYIEV